jgi:hypothetical protein
MANTRRKYCSLVGIMSSFLLFSNIASAQNDWIRSLKNFAQPGRIKITHKNIQQDKKLSGRAVFLKHRLFLLDRSYVPRLKRAQGHIVLQLSSPITPTVREKLKKHGVQLLDYLPSNTWKARIPAAAVLTVKALDFVNAMGDIYSTDKFPKHVLEKDFHAHTYNDDGTISVLVTFHRDVGFNRVMETVAELSGTTEQTDFITGHRILLRISQERLQDLAEYDEVNWIEDRFTPKHTNNINAAVLSEIDDIQAAPYHLDGLATQIGQWDGGEVQDDHPDLYPRVTNVETSSVISHSTVVAGTMIGTGGGNASAKGLATSATLYSYDFYGDVLSEMSSAVSTYGIQLSNNSWGYAEGWEWNYYGDGMWVWFGDSSFGTYTSESQAWDQTVTDTDLIIVKSAGNDRSDNGDESQSGHHHWGDSLTVHYDYHSPDGNHSCIGQQRMAGSNPILWQTEYSLHPRAR